MKCYVFLVDRNGEKVKYLSLLDPKKAFKKGITGKAIVGIIEGNETKISQDNFIANKEFKEFMQSIIAKEIFNDSSIKNQAKKSKEGYIYLIDARTLTPQGEVPHYDIIGTVKIEDGKLVNGSYHPNKNHALVGPKGIFQLPNFLEKQLLKKIKKL